MYLPQTAVNMLQPLMDLSQVAGETTRWVIDRNPPLVEGAQCIFGLEPGQIRGDGGISSLEPSLRVTVHLVELISEIYMLNRKLGQYVAIERGKDASMYTRNACRYTTDDGNSQGESEKKGQKMGWRGFGPILPFGAGV